MRSVAGLILTTDAMVAELPKDEKPVPAWRRGHGLLIGRRATRPRSGGVFSCLPPARYVGAALRVSDAGRRRWFWAVPRSRAAAARENPYR